MSHGKIKEKFLSASLIFFFFFIFIHLLRHFSYLFLFFFCRHSLYHLYYIIILYLPKYVIVQNTINFLLFNINVYGPLNMTLNLPFHLPLLILLLLFSFHIFYFSYVFKYVIINLFNINFKLMRFNWIKSFLEKD